MPEVIELELLIEDPVLLELTEQPVYEVIPTPIPIQPVPPVLFGFGEKSSAVDAGILWQHSLTDDFVFICVKAGTPGNATWKREVIFHVP